MNWRPILAKSAMTGSVLSALSLGYLVHDEVEGILGSARISGRNVESGYFEDPVGLDIEARINDMGRVEVYLVHESGARAPISDDVFNSSFADGYSWDGFFLGDPTIDLSCTDYDGLVDLTCFDEYSEPLAYFMERFRETDGDDRVLYTVRESVELFGEYERHKANLNHPASIIEHHMASLMASTLLQNSERRLIVAYHSAHMLRRLNSDLPCMPDLSTFFEREHAELDAARRAGLENLR